MEIKIAIIGLVASFIGAAVGAGTSIWITSKELSLNRQNAMLGSLYKELEKLEAFSQSLSNIKFHRGNDPQENSTRYLEIFQTAYMEMEPSSHLINRGIWGNIRQVATDLDNFILEGKRDPSSVHKNWVPMRDKMANVMLAALAEIEESRRVKQEEIERIRSLLTS